MIAYGRSWRQAMSPYASGDAYLNFLGDEGADRARAAYGPANHERLARVKAQWDPHDVFRGSVRPARAD